MKVTEDIDLRDFEFWSGARDNVKYLTDDELDTIQSILEDSYPDGMSKTDINDFFWFDCDTIAEWLGYSDFEELMNRDVDNKLEEVSKMKRTMKEGFKSHGRGLNLIDMSVDLCDLIAEYTKFAEWSNYDCINESDIKKLNDFWDFVNDIGIQCSMEDDRR